MSPCVAANAPHRLEAALVDGRPRHAGIEQPADHGFAQAAGRDARLELGDAGLQQLAMQRTLRRPCATDASPPDRCRPPPAASASRKPPGTSARPSPRVMSRQRIERGDDLARCVLLQRDERIVGGHGPAILANLLGQGGDRRHHRIGVGEQSRTAAAADAAAASIRPAAELDERANERLHECAVEREVGLGHSRGGCEPPLVGRIVAAERADVVQRPCFAAHHPIAGREIGIAPCPRSWLRTPPRRGRAAACRSGRCCWRTRRAPFARRRRKRRCRGDRRSRGSCRRSSGHRSGSRRRPRRDRESSRAPAAAA